MLRHIGAMTVTVTVHDAVLTMPHRSDQTYWWWWPWWAWVWGFVFFIGFIILFAFLLSPPTHHAPAPAPVPPPPIELCEWCDDLLDNVASNVRSERASGDCIELSSSDFADGTYVMNVPDACYVLTDDITFSPAEAHDFRATKEPYASNPAFVLDFFAAIVVQARGVSIDLQGHTLKQHTKHYVQQRFFALIELASSPFISGQGPADFVGAGTLAPAAQFTLTNGRLGLSSHHGIHGNGAWDVLIQDVDIVDYEVGAIALNGVHNVVLKRVRALGTFTAVPVLGTYSSARFMMPFVVRALAAAQNNNGPEKMRLLQATVDLQQLMNEVFQDVAANGVIDKQAHPDAYALFGNPSGLPDGSASYGFILNAHGVAVNGMQCDREDSRHDELSHILIDECEVRNTRLDTVEVVALREVATGKVQRGPAGDILRIAEIFDSSDNSYKGTALSDTKIALAALSKVLNAVEGTTTVHDKVDQWSRGVGPGLVAMVASGDFDFLRNGDTMVSTSLLRVIDRN